MSTSTKINSKRRGEEGQFAHGGGISHASSLSKRQKVTKDSLLKGSVVEEVDALSSILPLRLAALGGYLPLKDTGRFLLRVSKDMTTSIFEERMSSDGTVAAAEDGTVTSDRDGSEATDTEVNTASLRQIMARNEAWKYLCKQKWRSPSTLEHLDSVLGGAHDASGGEMATRWERLFRKSLPCPPKPAVRASVEDYSFVFSLKKCDESERDSAIPLTTFVLKGDEAVKFLKTGESAWLKLDSPIMLGNFASNEAFWDSWEEEDMISTLHGLRKSDGKMCELNYQTVLTFLHGDNFDVCYWTNGEVINVGDLKQIMSIRDVNDVGLGFSIDRQFRITASEKDDGSADYRISHIEFSATLFIEGGGYDYKERTDEMESGVTVADFLSRLDVEWK